MKKKNGNTWSQAYSEISKLILSSVIKPGDWVTEIGLSKQIGIGRTPIREALHKLEQEGLIVTENRRKKVYLLTISEIEEIFDIKICLESKICYWAAAKGSASDKKAAQKLLSEMKSLIKCRPSIENERMLWFTKWNAKDEALHQLIFKMSNNKRSVAFINNLNKQWHCLRVGIMAIEERIDKSFKEHEKFVNAVISGKAVLAEQAMIEHLTALKQMLLQLLKMFNYPVS